MAKVIIKKASYDYSVLRSVIFELLDSLNAMDIKKDAKVLIKPNLLAPASPEKAIQTHPLIVRAVVEYLNAREIKPLISDSPALGGFQRSLKEGGHLATLEGLDVEFHEFKNSVPVNVGKPFNRIELAEEAINADVIINLPKLKTHQQMLMTLGVKNLFGCVVGMRKPEWHFRTGINRDRFAELLVRIHEAMRPTITILDGILAMEGQGPGTSGTPRELGIIAASDNAIALDMIVCGILGIHADEVPTNLVVKSLGIEPMPINVEGDIVRVKDFKRPRFTSLVFGPKMFHGFMQRHMAQRPESDPSMCKMCGECWKYCPAHAIKPVKKKLLFNYDICIRCYCCQEVCPHGAISARETSLGRFFKKGLERQLKNR